MDAPERAWRTAYRHPTPWDSNFPPLSMVDLFDAAAAKAGAAPLIDFLGRHYSYAEVLDGANRVACGLKALGYGPGDRIGLFLPNVPHYLAAYYGILKLGATVVNFSPLYTVAELEHQVADSGTQAAVHAVGQRAAADRARRCSTAARSSGWWWDRSRAHCRPANRSSTGCSSAPR